MTQSSFKIDEKAIRTLAKILAETDLQEIEFECDAGRVRVARPTAISAPSTAANITPLTPQQAISSPSSMHVESPLIPQKEESDHPGTIKSPMVATAYLAPQPGAPNFVKEGDVVTKGQTLLILEAMKVMNPLKATKAGKILKIMVQDASPVEFDEPLLIIE